MKLIVLEALIGLQQVNQLFHYKDLPLLEQHKRQGGCMIIVIHVLIDLKLNLK